MLGTEQRHERDTRSSQSSHIADPICIHAGLVGHQADPAAADQLQAVVQQDVDTGTDPITGGSIPSCRGAAETGSPDTR
jgi:hypothetical protein